VLKASFDVGAFGEEHSSAAQPAARRPAKCEDRLQQNHIVAPVADIPLARLSGCREDPKLGTWSLLLREIVK